MLRQLRLKKRKPKREEQDRLSGEPALEPVDTIVLACWRDLDSCRALGGQGIPGTIPWTAVIEWARLHELGSEETRVLSDVIRALDVERVERISSEMETKRR